MTTTQFCPCITTKVLQKCRPLGREVKGWSCTHFVHLDSQAKQAALRQQMQAQQRQEVMRLLSTLTPEQREQLSRLPAPAQVGIKLMPQLMALALSAIFGTKFTDLLLLAVCIYGPCR